MKTVKNATVYKRDRKQEIDVKNNNNLNLEIYN